MDSARWDDLDQFMGICFNEDMDELHPAGNYRESARKAVADFFKVKSHNQVQQVRRELQELLDKVNSDTRLGEMTLEMGCAWDFSLWGAWLQSILNQIDRF